MKVKDPTVKIDHLHPAMGLVLDVADEAAREFGLDEATITSGQDGRHMVGSKHHQDRLDLRGEAVDIGVRPILEAFLGRVKQLLEHARQRTYDVILEVTPTWVTCPKCAHQFAIQGTHVHAEHDPKRVPRAENESAKSALRGRAPSGAAP
jgi:hypothetical protein